MPILGEPSTLTELQRRKSFWKQLADALGLAPPVTSIGYIGPGSAALQGFGSAWLGGVRPGLTRTLGKIVQGAASAPAPLSRTPGFLAPAAELGVERGGAAIGEIAESGLKLGQDTLSLGKVTPAAELGRPFALTSERIAGHTPLAPMAQAVPKGRVVTLAEQLRDVGVRTYRPGGLPVFPTDTRAALKFAAQAATVPATGVVLYEAGRLAAEPEKTSASAPARTEARAAVGQRSASNAPLPDIDKVLKAGVAGEIEDYKAFLRSRGYDPEKVMGRVEPAPAEYPPIPERGPRDIEGPAVEGAVEKPKPKPADILGVLQAMREARDVMPESPRIVSAKRDVYGKGAPITLTVVDSNGIEMQMTPEEFKAAYGASWTRAPMVGSRGLTSPEEWAAVRSARAAEPTKTSDAYTWGERNDARLRLNTAIKTNRLDPRDAWNAKLALNEFLKKPKSALYGVDPVDAALSYSAVKAASETGRYQTPSAFLESLSALKKKERKEEERRSLETLDKTLGILGKIYGFSVTEAKQKLAEAEEERKKEAHPLEMRAKEQRVEAGDLDILAKRREAEAWPRKQAKEEAEEARRQRQMQLAEEANKRAWMDMDRRLQESEARINRMREGKEPVSIASLLQRDEKEIGDASRMLAREDQEVVEQGLEQMRRAKDLATYLRALRETRKYIRDRMPDIQQKRSE